MKIPLVALLLACAPARSYAEEFKFKKAAVPEATPRVAEDAPVPAANPAPPPAKEHPNDAPSCQGDMANMTVVKANGGATLYSDSGAGMKSSPRHYCIHWLAEGLPAPKKPLLIFIEPPTDEYPSPPREFFLASKPGKIWEGLKLAMPYQVWKYPEKPASKGMYSLVSGFDKDKKPQESSPVIWWGLSKGQDLETISREERKKVYEELK